MNPVDTGIRLLWALSQTFSSGPAESFFVLISSQARSLCRRVVVLLGVVFNFFGILESLGPKKQG